jgi:hypothetical protein
VCNCRTFAPRHAVSGSCCSSSSGHLITPPTSHTEQQGLGTFSTPHVLRRSRMWSHRGICIGLYMRRKNNRMNMGLRPLFYASVRSRRRRIVLQEKKTRPSLASFTLRRVKKTTVPAHCRRGRSRHRPRATCNRLLTCRAIPNADRLTLHSILNK